MSQKKPGHSLSTFATRAAATGALCLCAACSGTMKGVVRGEGTPVTFAYETGLDSDKLTAVIDGETFQGKAVMSSTSTFGSAFGSTSSGFQSTALFGSAQSSDAMATLFGSKGSTMSCQLRYADSDGFIIAGGVGVCQHSDGRLIDVMW